MRIEEGPLRELRRHLNIVEEEHLNDELPFLIFRSSNCEVLFSKMLHTYNDKGPSIK